MNNKKKMIVGILIGAVVITIVALAGCTENKNDFGAAISGGRTEETFWLQVGESHNLPMKDYSMTFNEIVNARSLNYDPQDANVRVTIKYPYSYYDPSEDKTWEGMSEREYIWGWVGSGISAAERFSNNGFMKGGFDIYVKEIREDKALFKICPR